MENKKETTLSMLELAGTLGFILGAVMVIVSSFLLQQTSGIMILVIGSIVVLSCTYPLYKVLDKKSKAKQKTGSLLIGIVGAILIFMLVKTFYPLSNLEESSISWRFVMLKGGVTKSEKESETGKIEYTAFHPPPGARQDIQIIGITTNTLNKLEGVWPLPWSHYANVIQKFKGTSNLVMFDIFMLDYKKGQVEEMEKALKGTNNIMFDYPLETSLESKELVKNLNKKQEELRRFKMVNIVDPFKDNQSWVKFADPPIEQIAKLSVGLGFANIQKDETALNRKMPLIAKMHHHGPNKETEYYPSIDLMIACKYLGVDVVKDTEVYFGKYLKIKNIPKKNIKVRKGLKFEEQDILAKPNDAREIVIPIDMNGLMEINFVGGRYSYKSWELFEIAEEWDKETASQFQNNIFLVAMYYATGRGASKDSHLAPFGDMSGIEHHAQALNTILNQDFLSNFPDWMDLCIYLLIGLLVGFVQPRVKTYLGFLLILVLAIAYTIGVLFIFGEYNLIAILPSVLIEQMVIFIGIIGFKILTEEANVKYIRNTFSKFVSKDVVDELLKHPDNIALGGAKREITIYFSDIRGFTTISEKLGPEELVRLLNEYLSTMTEIIIEYKGTIDKYMGDAIMAFWGAPVPLEDHAYYACISALYQMKHLKKMQEEWVRQGRPSIDIGIGLNTGNAVVGNMGSSHRMEYTCMGDTINLGSRLEGSNKTYGTHIIMSEYVYERVKDRVYARELDLVQVKGKTQPVRIYELIGLIQEEDFEKFKRPIQVKLN